MIVPTGRADMGANLGLMVPENRRLTSKGKQDPERVTHYATPERVIFTNYWYDKSKRVRWLEHIQHAWIGSVIQTFQLEYLETKNSFEKLWVDGNIILKFFFQQVAGCPQVVTFPVAFSLSLCSWMHSKDNNCFLLFFTWDYVFRL
jgi:hypothetical protein